VAVLVPVTDGDALPNSPRATFFNLWAGARRGKRYRAALQAAGSGSSPSPVPAT